MMIQNGILVTPDGPVQADVLIEGERIAAIGRDLATPGAQVIDAAGCLVLPGVIDAHTHIALDTGVYRTPDDWFVGTRAAACGGVTTVVDFATRFPGQTARQAVETRQAEARDVVIDYALHVMGVTDAETALLQELVELGTPSIKLYTTYRPSAGSPPGRPCYYADDATILRLMTACAEPGIRVLVHCEDDAQVTAQTEALVAAGKTGWRHHGQSRPALAEQEAVGRVLALAATANCSVHIVHCSTARSVELVAEARARGQAVSCETCPQYLLLDNRLYDGPEPWRYILQPPLRDPGEPERLWALVAQGAVDQIATDHCDYTVAQKTAVDDFTRTPGGLPALETVLPLMYTYGVAAGRLTLAQLVALLSANPARLWGLWPCKGALPVGADADLIVYDPRPESVIRAADLHHLAGYTPYEGLRIQGRVQATVARGEVIYQDRAFVGRKGRGRFVNRGPLT